MTVLLGQSSAGKSGSFFFYTADGKFMIKTIRKEEFDLLIKILPEYYSYIMKNPETYISRFYGLHRLKCYKKDNTLVKNIYILVMNSVFEDI